ncbi:hypothetical protein ASH00_15655 [Arthrobacter sp. Soil782]|uniref:UvrD-helicase domain-containing protein n=1 Tax=Arthrobacter sp. Soil782 TaxID=1736410 RepID=UPI0006FEFFE1|nr:UvrD-helicase domain-containing protein [Arthrobacter sp. Soil782]KRF03454.1 hypothetical protein ASH00_15655 [Arthrobacter sp. Soil782]
MNTLSNVLMISASAGTGKTHALTNVIADRIAGGTPAAAIMATTFTKKAAGELKERIALRLLDDQGSGAHGSGAQNSSEQGFSSDNSSVPDPLKLKEAAQQLSTSLIGTVNSVCSRLLTEYAIDAGLSPALEAIAEGEQDGIFRLATDEVLADYSEQILPIARRMSMVEDDAWMVLVRGICDAARNNLLQPQDLAACAKRSWQGYQSVLEERGTYDGRQAWLDGLRQALPELRAVVRDGVDPAGRPVNVAAKNFAENWPKVVHRITSMGDVEDVSWEQWRGAVPAASSKLIKTIFEQPITAFSEELLSNPAFHDDIEQFIRLIYACAAECLEAFERFKHTHGLMDFVDQETLALKLVRENEAFRQSFSQRVQFLVVDEFQDTSPLQLELFLQLSRLVDRAVWVGDPKQAIYEFRGTDPELMDAVVSKVTQREMLSSSWRSEQVPLDLSNATFIPLFAAVGMSRESVELRLPDARADCTGGFLEAWSRTAGKDEERLATTAVGVADLLRRRPELVPKEIAVLTRTNKEAQAVAAALSALGIRATLNSQPLLSSREVQLARASLAFVADARDTIALSEVVALHPGHRAHEKWQQALLASPEPAETLAQWAADPLCTALTELNGRAIASTPTEVFEEVVSLIGLPALLKTWSAPETRLRNLDAVRAEFNNYYEAAKALKAPATLRGALQFLSESEAVASDNSGDDVVNVMTYHKAKGLEWPVVIMESLDREVGARAFGVAVESDGEFDLDEPLAGRWIRFWPSPFPYKGSPLDAAAKSSDVLMANEDRERRNAARLMYVGMTRSINTTILTAKGSSPLGLNDLGITGLIKWSGEKHDGVITVNGNELPAYVQTYVAEDAPESVTTTSSIQYDDAAAAPLAGSYLPARIKASAQTTTNGTDTDARIYEHAHLGDPLATRGDERWASVGSAVHAYLGTEYTALDRAGQLGVAKEILDRWQVGDLIGVELLLTAGDRFAEYLASVYPGAPVLREVPISWRTGQNQYMEGWIDLLIELPEGFVLIDHKSYPGEDPAKHIRKENLGQMETYRQALLDVTGKPVVETLIHLPALGKVYKID